MADRWALLAFLLLVPAMVQATPLSQQDIKMLIIPSEHYQGWVIQTIMNAAIDEWQAKEEASVKVLQAEINQQKKDLKTYDQALHVVFWCGIALSVLVGVFVWTLTWAWMREKRYQQERSTP